MGYKTALGLVSIAMGAVAYAIYFWQTTRQQRVQPHPFSWFLWGLVTCVAYLAQRQRGGGAGSWVTAFTGAVCFAIGVLSLLKHRRRFNAFDWASLGLGLGVFAFYLVAQDPTGSAIVATATDLVGFAPTVHKGWLEPHRDSATSFTLNGLQFVPALFALDSYSLASWLFPASLIAANAVVVAVLLVRRRQVG